MTDGLPVESIVTIDGWMVEAHNTAISKGWWDGPDGQRILAAERNLGEQLALFHSEISEALEEWRAGHPITEVRYEESGKPVGFPIEIADLLIRVFDTTEAYGIDLQQALEIKAAYNRSRPYRHGGKKA